MVAGSAALAQDSAIEVRVLGLQTDDGHVVCTLYEDAESWLSSDTYVASNRVKPAHGEAVCRFPSIPAGTYAVTFIHDTDDNGSLETNFLGMPKEPWGVSCDPRRRMGPPRFDASSFEHPGGEVCVATVR